MKLTIDQKFKLAITAHQEGKLDEAENIYREILKTEPKHPDANHNLGLIVASLNKPTEALKLFKTATEENPNKEQFWISYTNQLIKENKLDVAEVACRKAIEINPGSESIYNNLGVTLNNFGRFDKAEIMYKKAIELKQNFVECYINLATTLKVLGKIDEAEIYYKKAIELKTNYTVYAYTNLGNMFMENERLDEAEFNLKKAIELKPDYAEAYNSLGALLYKLVKIDEAVINYKKAIELKPDFATAHSNLSIALFYKGDLISAINNSKQAINIQPEFTESWHNFFFPLQTIKSQISLIEDHLPLLSEELDSKYAKIEKNILVYRLYQGSLSKENYLNKVINILSDDNDILIKNPKIPTSEIITDSSSPKKITALLNFGRSGSGMLHSLIDNHPEVSTLPSIYFSEFFNHFTWKKIISGGWEEIVDRFVSTYEVLFDASSSVAVATKGNQLINNIGYKEGMMNIGTEKNEILSVDKKIFIKELKLLMDYHDHLDQFTFFKLVHSAYDKSLQDLNNKNHVFYHIHNPDIYAQLNYLRLAPNTNWLIMIREPIQSCESWILRDFRDNDYEKISTKIFEMLFEIDNAIYHNENSIGVKLEDLKEHPKKTIQALCGWMDIKENDSLYQMTVQGKKWWGDPTSPDFAKDGMNPFGKMSINRKLGSVFSKNDQFILRTLFYPFNVRFNYVDENLEKFKKDLQDIRPMLDEMFDFERKIAEQKKISKELFMKQGHYLFLRSGMIERWDILNKSHSYSNMLIPINIDQF